MADTLTLKTALRRLGIERAGGHCGEGNVERRLRAEHNEAVDVVLAALKAGQEAASRLTRLDERMTVEGLAPVIMRAINDWTSDGAFYGPTSRSKAVATALIAYLKGA